MSLNFPSAPNINDLYNLGSRTWRFNGNGWEVVPPQGDTGFTGSAGEAGFTGSIGFTGSQGEIGFTGSAGNQGIQGQIGLTGSQGEVGFTGSAGLDGAAVDRGFTGSQGDTGFVGSQGELGFTGSQGEGFTGSQGETGFTGSSGLSISFAGSVETINDLPQNGNEVNDAIIVQDEGDLYVWDGTSWENVGRFVGYTGSQGDAGFTGSQGEVGFTGSQGIAGEFAAVGFTGSKGETGFTGSSTGTELFTDLNDTPTSYLGQAGKVVVVNNIETGLEFVEAPSNGTGPGGSSGADSYVKTYFWEGALQENVSLKRFYIHTVSTLETITVNLGSAGTTQSTIQIKLNDQVLDTIVIPQNIINITEQVNYQLAINDYFTVDITQSSSAVNLYVTFVYRE